MDAVNRGDVHALVKSCGSTAAARTVEQRYSILAIMLRAAVKDRVIPASPCVDIKQPRIEPKSALVPITTETVLALREAMPARYRALVTLAAGTGMRRGEPIRLRRLRTPQDRCIDAHDPRRPGGAQRDARPRRGLRTPRLRSHLHDGERVDPHYQHDPLCLAARGARGRGDSHPTRPTSLLRLDPDPRWAVHQGAPSTPRPQVRSGDLGHLRAPDGRRGRPQSGGHRERAWKHCPQCVHSRRSPSA